MDNSLMVDEQTLWNSGVRPPSRKPYASISRLPAKLSKFLQKSKKTFFNNNLNSQDCADIDQESGPGP
jgi:hypothetical protein